jgi:2-keto-3-deoxy-L-rhamnonate aldolase RhmA
MARVCDAADMVPVIAQIEHPDAVADVEPILAVDTIAGILIGRADLALSMGYDDAAAPEVDRVVRSLLAQTAGSDKIIGMVVADHFERDRYAALGANWFLVGTDHSYLRLGARAALIGTQSRSAPLEAP